MSNFQTDYIDVTHPGETLLENLEFLCISQAELSERTGLTTKHISNIINGKASITPDTAIKLEKALGIKARFWNAREKNYQEAISRINAYKKLEEEKEILLEYKETFKELVRIEVFPPIRWIEKNFPEIIWCLQKFLGVDSLSYMKGQNIYSAAYRKYENKKTNENTIAAWLRLGELQTQKIETPPYNAKKLEENILKIRELCTSSINESVGSIKLLLRECGIVLICAPYLKNTHTQGAVQWVGKDKIMVMLKTTHQQEDRFWFNLFHELGHILKHGRSKTFIDVDDNIHSKEEKEADIFSQKMLLPEFDREEINNYSDLNDAVEKLSQKHKTSKSIIAGRLSFEFKDNRDVYKILNPFIRRMDYHDIDVKNILI